VIFGAATSVLLIREREIYLQEHYKNTLTLVPSPKGRERRRLWGCGVWRFAGDPTYETG
jgi:hypothetical protein